MSNWNMMNPITGAPYTPEEIDEMARQATHCKMLPLDDNTENENVTAGLSLRLTPCIRSNPGIDNAPSTPLHERFHQITVDMIMSRTATETDTEIPNGGHSPRYHAENHQSIFDGLTGADKTENYDQIGQTGR